MFTVDFNQGGGSGFRIPSKAWWLELEPEKIFCGHSRSRSQSIFLISLLFNWM